ncbi:DUF4097 family beta strand repeat-containing protein [Streptomyces sp. NPDC001415]
MVTLGSGARRREVFSSAAPVLVDVELGVGEIRVRLVESAEIAVEVRLDTGWSAAAQPGFPNGGVWSSGYSWGRHPEHHPAPHVPGIPPVPSVPSSQPMPSVAPAGWAWAPGHGAIPPGHGYVPGYGTVPPGRGYIPGQGAVLGAGGAVSEGGVETAGATDLDDVLISFSPESGLKVSAPQGHPLRSRALVVDITAPAHSRLSLRTGSGGIAVAGAAAVAQLVTASGSVDLERVEESARLETGTGAIAVGHLSGNAQLRTGSGMLAIGTVEGEVSARVGTGQIVVDSLAAGRIDAETNSGEIRVRVPRDRVADVDARSGAGGVYNDLIDEPQLPASAPRVHVGVRTGSGRIRISRAS